MLGQIAYFNQDRSYGFILVTVPPKSPKEAAHQEKFFFHHSNFTHGETPVVGAFVIFVLGPGVTEGKKLQAVGVRFATPQEIGTATSQNTEVRQ